MQAFFVFPMATNRMDIAQLHLQLNHSEQNELFVMDDQKKTKYVKSLLLRHRSQFFPHHIKPIAVYSNKQTVQCQLSNCTRNQNLN